MTLWVIVIVTLAAAYFDQRVTNVLELAQHAQRNTQAAIDMASTRAELLYRLGTTSMTEAGVGRGKTAVQLDNRLYRGLGETTVRLQDGRGLVNLNLVDDDRLNRFLGQLGIVADQRGPMIDTLRDYTDEDKLHRLNGAEEEDYLALKLPPPTNRKLSTPWEAMRIIGWRNRPELWANGTLVKLSSTGQAMGINPNTAPAEVLATIPGVTADNTKLILARRQVTPFLRETDISALTGWPLNLPMGMGVIPFPGDNVRMTQSAPGLSWALQFNVTLTPSSLDAPWQIDYFTRVSNPVNEPPQLDGRVGSTPLSKLQVEVPELPPRSDAPLEKLPAFLMPN